MIHRPKDEPTGPDFPGDAGLAGESLARIRLGLIALSDQALAEPLTPRLRLLLRRLEDAEQARQRPRDPSDGA
jgi:hypothetical protein